MIKLENLQVEGFEPAIRGMRNPMNSWENSDSDFIGDACDIGPKDLDLMETLATSGSSHSKYRRMITIYVDITAPLYMLKEFDTYKVGTVANSCSTMHKIHAKYFEREDFSTDHLNPTSLMVLDHQIDYLNRARADYLTTKRKEEWWQMIQLLPSSYNQKRTVMLNYEVVAKMIKDRNAHKLDEWRYFCKYMLDELPYAKYILADVYSYRGLIFTEDMK